VNAQEACWEEAAAQEPLRPALKSYCEGESLNGFRCNVFWPVADCVKVMGLWEDAVLARAEQCQTYSCERLAMRKGGLRLTMTRSALTVLAAMLLVGCDGDDPSTGHRPSWRRRCRCPSVRTPNTAPATFVSAPAKKLWLTWRRAYATTRRSTVRIDVLSESTYAAMVVAGFNEPEASTIAFHRALTAFGLAPANLPSAMTIAQRVTANTLGLYRATEKRIIIIDHGEPADSVQSNLTLLHEFIHALQDSDHDLVNWPAGAPWNSFDSSLARRALVEGEARFYEYRAAVPFLGLDIAEADFESALQEHLEYVSSIAFESDTR
jgi:hypothetical protein